jgi:hypothetical protein
MNENDRSFSKDILQKSLLLEKFSTIAEFCRIYIENLK